MRKNYLLFLGGLLLFGFILLSKYEDRQGMRWLDYALTVKVQERIDRSSHLRASAFIGNVMEGASFFASPEFTVVTTLVLTALVVYDRKKKKWNSKAIFIPLALVVIVLIEIYGKSIVHHPAPPFTMIKNPTTMFPADYINEEFSYPSGHAARAIFLGLMVLPVFGHLQRKLFIVAGVMGYVALVAVSRVYLGHHWFSDVMGGLLLGCAVGVLTWVILPPYNKPTMSD